MVYDEHLYDVIIIGGGATGTSVFRDVVMRGMSALLIERGEISKGTSKNSHQNLVSGMRYVVKDASVAQECRQENEVMARICPDLITGKKNFFVGSRSDYVEQAIDMARRLGIPFQEYTREEARKEVAGLGPEMEVALETDDRNIDIVEYCHRCCRYGRYEGSNFTENTVIERISFSGGFDVKTNKGEYHSRYLVNATGPWTNSVLSHLGKSIPMRYSLGSILVMDAITDRGIQHLHPPSDCDAYIVHDGKAWLGTTSMDLQDPDRTQVDEEFVSNYLLDGFSKVLPEVKTRSVHGLFSGIRPLVINQQDTEDARSLSRDFQIIESQENLFSVVGGKLTTARMMAEKVTDMIADREGNGSSCRTHVSILD